MERKAKNLRSQAPKPTTASSQPHAQYTNMPHPSSLACMHGLLVLLPEIQERTKGRLQSEEFALWHLLPLLTTHKQGTTQATLPSVRHTSTTHTDREMKRRGFTMMFRAMVFLAAGQQCCLQYAFSLDALRGGITFRTREAARCVGYKSHSRKGIVKRKTIIYQVSR